MDQPSSEPTQEAPQAPTEQAPTEPTEEQAPPEQAPQAPHMVSLSSIRQMRQELLDATDKHALPDYPYSSQSLRDAWLMYRQQLRDITKTLLLDATGENAFEPVAWPYPPS